MTRAGARILTSAILPIALACPLRAQVVTGVLLDGSANRPIAAAFVQLLDSAGVRRAGALTDSAGRFVVRARSAGAYRLRAERIGYASETSPVLRLTDAPLNYVFALQPQALTLPPVSARSDPRGCERRPDGPAVYALWNAVRAALSVTSWSRESGALLFSMFNFEREFDPSLRYLRREKRTAAYAAAALPYGAFDPEYLARNGYYIDEDDDRWLLGPDADVLLSESFLDSHCFRIVRSPDTTLVGLGFEPLRRDDRTDVSGVLWLERRTSRLRHLAYRFENVPPHLRRFESGGEVHFRQLDNGLWFVDRWFIRSPLVGATRNSNRYELIGYREDGGVVTSAATIPTDRRVRTGRGVIEGSVLDSITGRPLANALVFLAGTTLSAVTSASGEYRIARVPDGTYAIGVTHPLLDELGVTVPARRIDVSADEPSTHTLATPAMPTILRTVCPGAGEERTTGLVYGVVRDEETTAPLAGVDLRASWIGPRPDGAGRDRERTRTVRTDGEGRYFVCWLPTDRRIELRVNSNRVRHRTLVVELYGAPMMRRDFD